MATLRHCWRTVTSLKPFLANRSIATTSVVTNWNKDWKPGPYPKTPEERLAAAKKYGLRVEDYEPFPDDGTGHGDYPNLPYASGDYRDPYADWDYPDSKTNYNEVRHVDYDILTEDRWDPNRVRRYSLKYQLCFSLSVMAVLITIYVLTLPYPHFHSALGKQLPLNNLYLENGGDPDKEQTVKHYTFEPAN